MFLFYNYLHVFRLKPDTLIKAAAIVFDLGTDKHLIFSKCVIVPRPCSTLGLLTINI